LHRTNHLLYRVCSNPSRQLVLTRILNFRDNSKPARYYDMDIDLNKSTLRDVERWLNDKISSSSSSNSS